MKILFCNRTPQNSVDRNLTLEERKCCQWVILLLYAEENNKYLNINGFHALYVVRIYLKNLQSSFSEERIIIEGRTVILHTALLRPGNLLKGSCPPKSLTDSDRGFEEG